MVSPLEHQSILARVTIIPASQTGQSESVGAVERLRREIRRAHLERQALDAAAPRFVEQIGEQSARDTAAALVRSDGEIAEVAAAHAEPRDGVPGELPVAL